MEPLPIIGDTNEVQHVYEELDTNTINYDRIAFFENGQTITFAYEIIANEIEGSKTTQGEITINAEGLEETKINTISNNIEQADLKLNLKYRVNEDVQLYYGDTIDTILKPKIMTRNGINVIIKFFQEKLITCL